MSKNLKVCPLLSIVDKDYIYCGEEECAWWSVIDAKCVISMLSGLLR